MKRKLLTACLAMGILCMTACSNNGTTLDNQNADNAEIGQEGNSDAEPGLEELFSPKEETYSTDYVTIKKIGEMPFNAEIDRELKFEPDYLAVYDSENGSKQYYDVFGQPIVVEDCANVSDKLVWREKKDEVTGEHYEGISDLDGTELVPLQIMKKEVIDPHKERYYVLKIAEKQVSGEEKYLYYHDRSDSYYAGYITFFDRKEKKLLDNLVVRDSGVSFHGVGDNIIIENVGTRDFAIYNSNGELIKEFKKADGETYNFYEYFIIMKKDHVRKVFDENGDFLFATNEYVVGTFSRDVLMYKTENTYRCVNTKGEVILPKEYDFVYGGDNGVIEATNGHGEMYYTIFTKDGIILEGEGYAPDVKSYGLRNGKVREDDTGRQDGGIWIGETGDYLWLGTYDIWNVMGFVAYLESDGSVSMREQMSGDILLSGYEAIRTAYGYIYALKDGIYSIFEVTDMKWAIREENRFSNLTESIAIQGAEEETEQEAESGSEQAIRVEDTGLVIGVTRNGTAVVQGVSTDSPDIIVPEKVYYESDGMAGVSSGVYAVGIIETLGSSKTVENIVIPDSVTTVSNGAFRDCENLKSITLPSGMTAIPTQAFMNCVSLERIELPAGVTMINNEAFKGCTNLKEVVMNSVLEDIGEGVFMDCAALEKVEVPESVSRIQTYAFKGCTSLREINIPTQVTSIEENVFQGCTALTQLTLHENLSRLEACALEGAGITYLDASNVGYIGNNALSNCMNLEEVVLGDTHLENSSFYGSSNIQRITYAGIKYADAWFKNYVPGAELIRITEE